MVGSPIQKKFVILGEFDLKKGKILQLQNGPQILGQETEDMQIMLFLSGKKWLESSRLKRNIRIFLRYWMDSVKIMQG